MEFKGFFNEEVCIVRYSDNACKYVKVENTNQLEEDINAFIKGGDYEIQYMNGDLSEGATSYPLTMYKIAEELDKDIRLVNGLYNHFGNVEDVEHVLSNEDYFIEEGHDKEDAFENYCDSIGILDEIPEKLRYYFDYEKFKRDCELEGLNIISTGIYEGNKELYLLTNY